MYLIKMDYEIVSDSVIAFNRPKVKNEEVSISRICENENEIDSVIESEHNAFLNKVQNYVKTHVPNARILKSLISTTYRLNMRLSTLYLKESGII